MGPGGLWMPPLVSPRPSTHPPPIPHHGGVWPRLIASNPRAGRERHRGTWAPQLPSPPAPNPLPSQAQSSQNKLRPFTSSSHLLGHTAEPVPTAGGGGSRAARPGAKASGRRAGDNPPPPLPPGLGCHTGVRKMSEGAGRAPRLSREGTQTRTHTHGTFTPASRTGPPSRPPSMTFPSQHSSWRGGGCGAAPAPPPPLSLTSSGRPAPPTRLPEGVRHGRAQRRRPRRRGPVSIFPLSRPGRRVAGRSRDIRYIVGIPFASRDPRGARVIPLPRPSRRIPAVGGASGAAGREGPLRVVAPSGPLRVLFFRFTGSL